MARQLRLNITFTGPVSSSYRAVKGGRPTSGQYQMDVTPTADVLHDSQVKVASFDTTEVAPTIVVPSLDDAPASPAPGVSVVDTQTDTQYLWNVSNSEWRKSVSVDSTGYIDPGDLADGSIGQAKLAPSLSIIDVVSAFPLSPSPGEAVYLTTVDPLWPSKGINQLYAWDSVAGDWVMTVDGEDIAANSITAGQIAAGAIGTDELAANSVFVKNMIVANFDNLIPDPGAEVFADLADSPAEVVGTDTGLWSIDTAKAKTGGRSFRFNQSTQTGISRLGLTGQPTDTTTAIPVTEDQELTFWGYVSTDAGTGNDCKLRLNFRDDVGNYVQDVESGLVTPTASWTKITVSGGVPAGATYVAPQIMVEDDNLTPLLYFDDFYCRVKLDGSLVVDGTITGDHLDIITVDVSRYIQSSNYDGSVGWQIKGDGDADFRGEVMIGGNLSLDGGTFSSHLDGEAGYDDRVEIGGAFEYGMSMHASAKDNPGGILHTTSEGSLLINAAYDNNAHFGRLFFYDADATWGPTAGGYVAVQMEKQGTGGSLNADAIVSITGDGNSDGLPLLQLQDSSTTNPIVRWDGASDYYTWEATASDHFRVRADHGSGEKTRLSIQGDGDFIIFDETGQDVALINGTGAYFDEAPEVYEFVIPRKTTAGDPGGGTSGQLLLNTVDNNIKVYEGGAWRTIANW